MSDITDAIESFEESIDERVSTMESKLHSLQVLVEAQKTALIELKKALAESAVGQATVDSVALNKLTTYKELLEKTMSVLGSLTIREGYNDKIFALTMEIRRALLSK
jgi:hypothetical protein